MDNPHRFRQDVIRPAKYAERHEPVAREKYASRSSYKSMQATTKTQKFSGVMTTVKAVSKIPKPAIRRLPELERLALHAVSQSGAAAITGPGYSPRLKVTFAPISAAGTSLLRKFTYGFAVLVLIISLAASTQSLLVNKQAEDQIASLGASVTRNDNQGVSQGTGNEPSEEAVPESAVLSYSISNPDHPKFLRIPELDVFARIKPLGIDQKGAVDSPWNIYDVGWYEDSARPGNPNGSSLLLGHVSGWSAPGVFKELNRLEPGSQFTVEKGNGQVITYEVNDTEQIGIDTLNMANVLSAEVPGEHDLKLMTCSGRYNSVTETYDDRYIVYANRVN